MKASPQALPLRLIALLLAALWTCASHAQQGPVRPGLEYKLIDQKPVPAGDRIEVIEFFWYGCPHCDALQGPIDAWMKRKPADVEWRYVPAMFRQTWVPHARVFFALESLGELPRLHQAVYRAIHKDKLELMTAESTADWAARQGIDRARWLAAYNAPDMEKKVANAIEATRSYKIEGTPSIAVDGRYVTSSGMAESYQQVITIMDELIRMAREKRGTGTR